MQGKIPFAIYILVPFSLIHTFHKGIIHALCINAGAYSFILCALAENYPCFSTKLSPNEGQEKLLGNCDSCIVYLYAEKFLPL